MPLSFVFCIAPSRALADWILHDLKEQRFPLGSIGLLFRESASIANSGETLARQAPSVSSEIRGVMQAIDEIGRIVIPGMGAYVVGGPIREALVQNLRKQDPGPLVSALRVLGMPTADAVVYDEHLGKGGTFLISIHSEQIERIEAAREIFKDSKGLHITTQLRPVFDASIAYRDPAASAPTVA